MKTITQWLQTLPEPYRSQALNQPRAIRFPGYPHDSAVDSLTEAINWAFSWDCTEQGENYWCDVLEQAQCGKFDRPCIDCTVPEEAT